MVKAVVAAGKSLRNVQFREGLIAEIEIPETLQNFLGIESDPRRLRTGLSGFEKAFGILGVVGQIH